MSNVIVREVKWYSKYAWAGIIEGICIGVGIAIAIPLTAMVTSYVDFFIAGLFL